MPRCFPSVIPLLKYKKRPFRRFFEKVLLAMTCQNRPKIKSTKTVGLNLNDPMTLLEDWSENYKFRRSTALDFYSMLSPSEFEFQLGKVCQERRMSYGLTGFSGSSRYAPVVRYQRVMAYVQGDIEALADSLAIKPVGSGFNVTLLKPYDEGVLFGLEDIEGSQVVSPIQVFLDLKSLRGRGEEAADALFERVIQKKWSGE